VASPALRRKQVRAAELAGTGLTYAEAGAVVGRSERTVARWLENPDLRAIADREGALAGDLGPAEILRGALRATKANGQPDWPTRVSAARALAALRPDEVEPEPEEEAPPSTVVYDLPPGAEPVLHRPRKGPEGSADPAEAPPARPAGMWVRQDTGELIAEYTPGGYAGATVTLHVLAGTPAEIDRDEAAVIDALSRGKELPTLE
jgi:Homeodomain-like domain